MDSRDAVLELILELLAEDEFRAGPSRRAGAAGLPARLAADARHDPRLARRPARARPAADDPARQGRLLGPRARPGRPARLDARRCSSVKADTDANFELLTRRLLDARPLVRVGDRLAQPALASPTRSPTTGSTGGADSRPRAAGPARARRPAAGRDRRPGPARAHLLPGRRPRRGHGLPRAAAAREHLQRVVPLRAGARRAARGAARAARRPRRWRADEAACPPFNERADPRAAAGARPRAAGAARWRPSTPSR